VDNNSQCITDRTGVVYQIVYNISSATGVNHAKLVPLFILNDGNGEEADGFKCEWMTVYDDVLVVGSTGKVWVDDQV
jgi:hypothetical protein